MINAFLCRKVVWHPVMLETFEKLVVSNAYGAYSHYRSL